MELTHQPVECFIVKLSVLGVVVLVVQLRQTVQGHILPVLVVELENMQVGFLVLHQSDPLSL
jgi:hypothetical protein